MSPEPQSRALLRTAERVVVKCGTSIVTNENGQVSLTRLGAIVEQISELVKSGTEVIFVSSGAVGMGKRLLHKQGQMNLSLNELHSTHENLSIDDRLRNPLKRASSTSDFGSKGSFASLLNTRDEKIHEKSQYDSACAAAGQFELINFYSSLFGQREVTCSQILVTESDFRDKVRVRNLKSAIDGLLRIGIVPIVNENDAVSANSGYTSAPKTFSDNDSLAGLCARSFDAQVLVMLTDVQGVYDRPPSEKGSKMLKFFEEDENVEIGEKSTQGERFIQYTRSIILRYIDYTH